MKTTSLVTLISVPLLAAVLSMGAYANEHAEHAGHADEAGKKMDMPMNDKMKAMQAEMQAIIDTEDMTKRKELFAAHKEKMHGMMGKMHAGCGKHAEHHGEKAKEHAHKEGDSHKDSHEHKEGDKH
jgi:hypothetical protein